MTVVSFEEDNISQVGDYMVQDTLGKGTYGQVKLVQSTVDGSQYAMKIIRKDRKVAGQPLEKEILIHRTVKKHANIIELFDVREDSERAYLIMELSRGGELFERIEPDLGIDEELAHFYFVQLVCAVDYLHKMGIAHRDLKPENLLLDDRGNLKLSDFGFATVFCHKGQKRRLNTPCGSSVYMAPEILAGSSYDGEQVDIWSIGVILYVMLTGTTPWIRPVADDEDFRVYCRSPYHDYPPWNRFSPSLKYLLESILCVDSSHRITMDAIKQNEWACKPNRFLGTDCLCADPEGLLQALMTSMHRNPSDRSQLAEFSSNAGGNISFSQPEAMNLSSQDNRRYSYFSQPDHPVAMMSQACTQNSQAVHPVALVASRLTRFYSNHTITQILEYLDNLLEGLIVPHKLFAKAQKIAVSTVDQRKCPLSGDILVQSLDRNVNIVIFQKHKGDPLEFKKFFRVMCQQAHELICQPNTD